MVPPVDVDNRTQFIIDNTTLIAPAHLPEIRLHTADSAHELWHKTEDQLQAIGLPPPFWAFAWAGGQGLARYILDNPKSVSTRNVLDFASGGGLVAICARLAGAANVTANDIDPYSRAAIELNAGKNKVQIAFDDRDLLDEPTRQFDNFEVILAGDVFYDQVLAKRVLPWLGRLKERGKTILIGDPGRNYFPAEQMTKLAEYSVPSTLELEDNTIKRVSVWEFTG